MAASPASHISYFFILVFLKHAKTYNIHFNMPEIQENDFNMKSHLKYDGVLEYCSRRDVCKSNNTNVCAVKMVNHKKFYKEFLNECYLFLSNMCDHPEEEYFIVTSGSCEQFLASRRTEEIETTLADYEETRNDTNSTENVDDTVNVTAKPALRKTFSTIYEIDTAYDYHPCPLSCPNVYNPVCLNVNRGHGKYFKLMVFVNHCASDIYYCKNWREFQPPPDEDESVRSSPLGWSFCGSSRYLSFARFSEAASSMGHYGWLAGDYKYSHIMEPHQKMPGLNRKVEHDDSLSVEHEDEACCVSLRVPHSNCHRAPPSLSTS